MFQKLIRLEVDVGGGGRREDDEIEQENSIFQKD